MSEFCKAVEKAIDEIGMTAGTWRTTSQGPDLCVLQNDEVALSFFLDVRDRAVTSALRFLAVADGMQDDMESHTLCRFFDLHWDHGHHQSSLYQKVAAELEQVLNLLDHIRTMNTPLEILFGFYEGYTLAYTDYMSGLW